MAMDPPRWIYLPAGRSCWMGCFIGSANDIFERSIAVTCSKVRSRLSSFIYPTNGQGQIAVKSAAQILVGANHVWEPPVPTVSCKGCPGARNRLASVRQGWGRVSAIA